MFGEAAFDRVAGQWSAVAQGPDVSAGAELARTLINWVNDIWGAVGPHATPYAYQNFIDPALTDWKRAYYGANLSRLSRVKRAYDPGDLFNFAQSIPTLSGNGDR